MHSLLHEIHELHEHSFDAKVTAYDMEDTYTQPFKKAIGEGGAAGIMYACNKVNGVPAVASADLAERLRSWGFNGYRTTDGDGINGMNDPRRQNYTRTVEESIALVPQV
jgi:beta-glucosidase